VIVSLYENRCVLGSGKHSVVATQVHNLIYARITFHRNSYGSWKGSSWIFFYDDCYLIPYKSNPREA
jgi:hypothetical protein